jgi:hypothetical protein
MGDSPDCRALDEDPDAALDVILGRHRGSKAYAAICLADAIRNGDYPAGWTGFGSAEAAG